MYSNGSNIPAYKDVPRSGHFLFQGPADSYVELNTDPVTRIDGRHSEIRIQSVNLLDLIPHMSHEDLDEYERISEEETANKLTEEQLQRFRDILGGGWWRNVKYYFNVLCNSYEYFIIGGIILLVLIALITLRCYCPCSRRRRSLEDV